MVVKTSWSINGIISAHAKFHPNRINNREVENSHFWSILFGWAGRLINGRRHFKLILSCVFSMFSSLAKFHPNRTKNTDVRNFHFWSILVGRFGRSKNGRRYLKLILCCFCPIISPHAKFHPNRTKNTEVRKIHFWSILVGQAGSLKMVIGISNSFYLVFAPSLASTSLFIPVGQKHRS